MCKAVRETKGGRERYRHASCVCEGRDRNANAQASGGDLPNGGVAEDSCLLLSSPSAGARLSGEMDEMSLLLHYMSISMSTSVPMSMSMLMSMSMSTFHLSSSRGAI